MLAEDWEASCVAWHLLAVARADAHRTCRDRARAFTVFI